MATSEYDTAEFVIPITPVPASRVRVPRFGRPFYVGKYADFRQHMRDTALPALITGEPLTCYIVFVCHKPAAPANAYPNGDVDNYIKAAWDQLNKRAFFQDDKQVWKVTAIKRYTTADEEPHIYLKFTKDHPHDD